MGQIGPMGCGLWLIIPISLISPIGLIISYIKKRTI